VNSVVFERKKSRETSRLCQTITQGVSTAAVTITALYSRATQRCNSSHRRTSMSTPQVDEPTSGFPAGHPTSRRWVTHLSPLSLSLSLFCLSHSPLYRDWAPHTAREIECGDEVPACVRRATVLACLITPGVSGHVTISTVFLQLIIQAVLTFSILMSIPASIIIQGTNVYNIIGCQ
jgi:hypothetical protein